MGYHQAVHVVLPDALRDLGLGVAGAGKLLVLRVNDVWQCPGELDDPRDVDDSSNIAAAVADQHADAWILEVVVGPATSITGQERSSR